ncbi:MAG: synthase subunit b [Gemmatimonadetes bacterium]|nr:synthase subunit b [Gemmatimonadota bacterium]
MIAKLLRIVPVLLLTATPLYAEEAGPLDVNVGLMIWTFIIFVVVLIVLGKYAWPHIIGAVEAREQQIRDLIAGAERDRAEAAAHADEQRRVLEETRVRVQDALGEARTTGERIREEMVTAARREHEELMQRARRDIEAERQSALESVRREAVDIALAAAEKLVQRSLTGDDDRRMVLDYLARVELDRTAGSGAGA